MVLWRAKSVRGWQGRGAELLAVALVVPGLLAAGRTAAPTAGKATTPSISLAVVTPEHRVTLTAEEMKALPQASVTVHNAHTSQDEQYSGPRLTDVLAKAQLTPGKQTLHGFVTATGTDGYWVLYSGEEISETVHAGSVIVALTVDGRALGRDGAFKLVSSEDKKPERWVRNLERVEWHLASE